MAIGTALGTILGAITGAGGILGSIGLGTSNKNEFDLGLGNGLGNIISDINIPTIKDIKSNITKGILKTLAPIIGTPTEEKTQENTTKPTTTTQVGTNALPATGTQVGTNALPAPGTQEKEENNTLPIIGTGEKVEETTIPNNPKIETETKEPIKNTGTGTTETEDNSINQNGVNELNYEEAYKMLKEYWQREDQLRQESYTRDDTAYQRMIKDMWKAGINPNLVNISGTPNYIGGSGYTNATKADYTPTALTLQRDLGLLEQAIQLEFQGDENNKNRLMQLVNTLGTIASVLFLKK